MSNNEAMSTANDADEEAFVSKALLAYRLSNAEDRAELTTSMALAHVQASSRKSVPKNVPKANGPKP